MLAKKKILMKYESNILPGALEGKIVVGFCYYVAGPMALQNLVDEGALVIKVEKKPIGDPSRYVFSRNMFNSMSYNQLSVAIDYNNPSDRKSLGRLLCIADVIVDNRSFEAKKKDTILQQHLQNPDKPQKQVYCSIIGFPNPEVNNDLALDASVQAGTGLAYTNCSEPDKPLKVGVPILDQTVGLLAAKKIISSLYFLLRFPSLPEGANKLICLSVSMAGAAMWLQTGQIINFLEGDNFLRSGNKDRFAVPFSFYTTKNGLMSIATVNEHQFKRFCMDVLKDETFYNKYSTFEIRLKNQDQFEEDLNNKLKNNSKEYWSQLCKEHRIPASPVLTIPEVMQKDFVKELMHSSTNGRPVVTCGISNSFFKAKNSLVPAPRLDQDRKALFELLADDRKLQSKL